MKKIIVLCLFCLYAGSNARSQEIKELIEGTLFGDVLVTSGKCTLTWEYVRVDSTSERASKEIEQLFQSIRKDTVIPVQGLNSFSYDIFFAFKGNKIYKEVDTPLQFEHGVEQFHDIYTYNGEKSDYMYLGANEKGLIDPYGYIEPANSFVFKKYDPRYDTLTLTGKPVGDVLEKAFSRCKASVTGPVSVQGTKCLKIQWTDTVSDSSFCVFIAPELNYRIVQLEITDTTKKNITRATYNKYGDDIFFPKTITKDRYYKEKNGRYVHYEKEVLTVHDDLVLNGVIEDRFFELKYPRGIYVLDMRNNEWFMIDYLKGDDTRMVFVPVAESRKKKTK